VTHAFAQKRARGRISSNHGGLQGAHHAQGEERREGGEDVGDQKRDAHARQQSVEGGHVQGRGNGEEDWLQEGRGWEKDQLCDLPVAPFVKPAPTQVIATETVATTARGGGREGGREGVQGEDITWRVAAVAASAAKLQDLRRRQQQEVTEEEERRQHCRDKQQKRQQQGLVPQSLASKTYVTIARKSVGASGGSSACVGGGGIKTRGALPPAIVHAVTQQPHQAPVSAAEAAAEHAHNVAKPIVNTDTHPNSKPYGDLQHRRAGSCARIRRSRGRAGDECGGGSSGGGGGEVGEKGVGERMKEAVVNAQMTKR